MLKILLAVVVILIGQEPAQALSRDQVSALIKKANQCSGNVDHYIYDFQGPFDYGQEMADLKNADDEYGGVVVSHLRYYTASLEGVLSTYDHVWKDILPMYTEYDPPSDKRPCLEAVLTSEELANFNGLFEDEENFAVMSSGAIDYTINEGFDWYRFRIYRKDGFMIELNFNYVD